MYEVFVLDPDNEAVATGEKPFKAICNYGCICIFLLLVPLVVLLYIFWGMDAHFIPFCGCISIVWVGFGVWGLWSCSIDHKLEKYGHLIEGEVRSCKGETKHYRYTVYTDFQVTLQYSFQSPNGHEITDETTQVANHLDKDTLPSPGTPVAIWYVDDKTYTVL